MLKKQFDKIQELTEIQLQNPEESVYTVLAHTNEELGEFCTAICVEDGAKVKGYKTLDESSSDEAVDVVICALSLFFARGGTIDQFNAVCDKKLPKWANNLS